jgi:predicted double-glycine peptidase
MERVASRAERAGARRALVPALVCSFIAAVSAPAFAGPSAFPGRRAVRSLHEIRQERVVKQKWDLSCGSAALSTLLTFDLGDPVSESEIIMHILRRSDPVRIRDRQGFSLLDLKRYVVSRGHTADGYGNLDMAHLVPLAPAIVPTIIGGENHFVVFRGAQEGRVLLADPGFGNRTMTVEQFEALWPRRIAFVVRGNSEQPTPPADSGLTIVRPSLIREAVGALR